MGSQKLPHISLPKYKTLSNLTISVNDVIITLKSSVKYLGAFLDQRSKRKVMELGRYSELTLDPNRNILKKLLSGIVDPRLLYASSVWADATNFEWCQTKLRSIQRLILTTTPRSFITIATKTTNVSANFGHSFRI